MIEAKYEQQFATDPWYIHLYRTSHAYHGVHPFYMWYWAAHAMDHVDDVIWVGGNRRTAQRLGFRAASTLADALELASGTVGSNPSITYLHNPPHLIADVQLMGVPARTASTTSAPSRGAGGGAGGRWCRGRPRSSCCRRRTTVFPTDWSRRRPARYAARGRRRRARSSR